MSTVEERYRALADKLGEYVRLIQAGEEECFTNLYEESLSYAFYSTRRYVKNEEDCKDIVQEGFIKVFYNLNTLQDVNKYLPWMKRIMINLSINFLKERRPELFLDYREKEEDFYQSDFIPVTESSETVLMTDESRQILEHLIGLLSEKQATILQLFYFDDLTIPEIATLLGIKEGTVKSRLFTARNNLKAATVAHEEKTGTRLYSLAALPLLFTNLDFSNVFRAVGQGLQEEIWHGIAGKLQFPLSLEIAKQVGRIGRAGQVQPPAQGTPRGAQQFHRTPQGVQPPAQGTPRGAQQTQGTLQGMQQTQTSPQPAHAPAQGAPAGQSSPSVSGQGFVRADFGSVPHATQTVGKAATKAAKGAATKAGMSTTAKALLAVGLSVVVAGTGAAGFLFLKNKLDPGKASPSVSSPIESEGKSGVITIDETTLQSEETEATQPVVSPWAQYTDIFKAKIAEVNASREKIIREHHEVGHDSLINVGEVEWSICDIGDNDEELPELFIRVPFTFSSDNEHGYGLSLAYRLEGDALTYVGQRATGRSGTFITDRENVVYNLLTTTTEKQFYESNDFYCSKYGSPAELLEPNTSWPAPLWAPLYAPSAAFRLFYKNTHNLNQALASDNFLRTDYKDGSLKYYTITTDGEHSGVLIYDGGFDDAPMAAFKRLAELFDDPSLLAVQFAPFEGYEAKVDDVLNAWGMGMLLPLEKNDDLASFMRARDVIWYGKHETPK